MMPVNYFALATAIARTHEAERRAANPCRCGLYPFPHRRSYRCEDYADEQRELADEAQRDRDMDRVLFDRAEIAAITDARMMLL